MRVRGALIGVWLVLAAALPCAARTPPPDPAAALPGVAAPVTAAPHERFAVYGDAGHGGAGQHQVAAAMAQWARRGGIDFVVSTGDNFYQRGVASLDDPQWRSKFESVYDYAALAVPFFMALGNHDHRGNVRAEIAYTQRSARWVMPAPYYSVQRRLGDGTELALFVLDTTPADRGRSDLSRQLRWLESALDRSRARWKIVIGHHPLYSSAPRGNNPRMIDALGPVLARGGTDLYFAGHDHVLELRRPVDGVVHVTSGAGGGPEWGYAISPGADSEFAATLGGFVGGTVARDALWLEFVRPDGRTQYVHVLRKPPPR